MFFSLNHSFTSAGIAPDGSFMGRLVPLRCFLHKNTDKIMNATIKDNNSTSIAMEAANQASSAATEKTEESLLPCAVVVESAAAAVEESSYVSVVYTGA